MRIRSATNVGLEMIYIMITKIRQACKESISESAYPFGDNSTKKKQRENGLVDLTKKFIELLQTASN